MSCDAPQAEMYLCDDQVDPQPEAVLGPFVEVYFDGFMITNSNVGYNGSDARACIKSFQFGRSVANGCGFKIEIITEEYNTMLKIVSILNKSKQDTNSDAHKVYCKFGWVKRNCNNRTKRISNESFGGGRLLFLVQTVESNFENGVYKLNVECCDLFQRTNQQTQGENNFGQDDSKMTLKDALKDIWTQPKYHPNVDQVEFKAYDNREPVSKSGTGRQFDFKNADGGPNGPKSTWQTKEKNKLSTTRNWLNDVLTKDNKGIIQIYDNEDDLSLVWQEDVIDDGDFGCNKRHLGSFVVNGGNCTPVISFSPKINWLTQNTGTGAVAGGSSNAGGERANNQNHPNPKFQNKENIGANQTESTGTPQRLWRPMSIQSKATQEAFIGNSHATIMYEVAGSIEAELTIQGNPKFSYNYGPNGIVGAYVSIAVLNPAVIRNSDIETGCVWLSESPVNEVLSNSSWLVKGVDHQITDGKYITTFKVMLPAPNSELNSTENFGGTADGFKPESLNVDLGDKP